MYFEWEQLAFGAKGPVNDLQATFLAAPRAISAKRFVQLIKQYLPAGNLVLGIAEEPYVAGFEGQPQFRMLRLPDVQVIIDKVNTSASRRKIYTLRYRQRDSQYLLKALRFRRVVYVNGSWRHTFHSAEAYYILAARHIPYELVSPFTDESEARAYEQATQPLIDETLEIPAVGTVLGDSALMRLTNLVARQSYDYSNQVGVVLARPGQAAAEFRYVTSSFNRVVPYQTFALHHGGQREINFSPPNDLNHYDTNHAEVELLIQAAVEHIDLMDTAFFINVLPCPTCARMLSRTPISQFVYQLDHSAGYALKLLEQAGKQVRRLVV